MNSSRSRGQQSVYLVDELADRLFAREVPGADGLLKGRGRLLEQALGHEVYEHRVVISRNHPKPLYPPRIPTASFGIGEIPAPLDRPVGSLGARGAKSPPSVMRLKWS